MPEPGKQAPGPRNLPFLGVVPMIRRDALGYLTHLAAEYGDLVHFRLLHRPAFLLAHPDLIREVLVTQQHKFTKTPTYQRMKRLLGNGLLTSDGDTHKRHRRLLQPAFNRESMPAYCRVMTRYAARASHRLVAGGVIDIDQEMRALTLAVIVRALFGADVESEAQELGASLSRLEGTFSMAALPFARLLRKLPLPRNRRANDLLTRVRESIDGQIREHRNLAQNAEDLVSTLLSLRYDDGAALSDEELRDEILTLFAAGYTTTSLALTWTWYLLARHPEAEERMHREIDTVIGRREPGMDDLSRLAYTANVVAESMRLFPPLWMLGRMAREDLNLGGYHIPAGSICLVSQWVTHHDARYFPDPKRFDPDRWNPELRDARPKFSYFPFGAGARVCIGDRFAQAEIVLVLATLAQKWKFRLAEPEPGGIIQPKPKITLRPGTPVRMRVIEREP